MGVRVRLAVRNNTLKDLWVHWTGQVDEDDKWDFVPNGNSVERRSERVTSNASFRIDVHKNDNGKVGEHLGGFNQSVSIVTTYDVVQLIAPRIELGGVEYVEFSYITASGTATLIGRFLLSDW